MFRYLIVIAAHIFAIIQIVQASKEEKAGHISKANNCLLYCIIALFGALMVLET